MEQVSVLLGRSSTKVTEKHWSPWVPARLEQIEADGRRTWGIHGPSPHSLQSSNEGVRPQTIAKAPAFRQ
jgi:hypothetical protein